MLCVVGANEFDAVLEKGVPVAEVVPASVQTLVCQRCGSMDTDAVPVENRQQCHSCGACVVNGPRSCSQCNAMADECCVLSYTGCHHCRPEAKLKGRVRLGPAAGILTRAAVAFGLMHPAVQSASTLGSSYVGANTTDSYVEQRVCHIC